MDRFEESVTKALTEIKGLVNTIHDDVVKLKIEGSRRVGEDKAKVEHKKDNMSVIALIVSVMTGVAEAIALYFQNKN